ncbi:MAG: hypothetical protein Q9187_002476 [Circinaria calcarea]
MDFNDAHNLSTLTPLITHFTIMPSADSPESPLTTNITFSRPAKPFSISLSSKPKAPLAKAAPLNSKKRPHSSLADDSDSDQERPGHRPQLVSAFDHSAGGAIGIGGIEVAKAPLVIQAQKNRDWREESRRKRGKNLLPAEVRAARNGKLLQGQDVVNSEAPAFGLTFLKKGEDVHMMDTRKDAATMALAQVEEIEKTEDQEAVEALMGNGKKKSNLVIENTDKADEMFSGRGTAVGIGDEDAFRLDIASRPDSASLDDYSTVPVDEIGAALLRGMGWNGELEPGKNKDPTKKSKVMERRPALLGIGAKEVPGDVAIELGAWGKGAKGMSKGAFKGKRKIDIMYNPVLLKNSRTGEMLTEEELKQKQENQKMEEEDWRRRRDKNLAINEERKSDRKYRDKDRSHKSSRHSSSRRDRSRSSERNRHRRRDHVGQDDYDRKDKNGWWRADERRDDSRSSKSRYRDDEGGSSRSSKSRHYDDDRQSRPSRQKHDGTDEHDDTRSTRRQEVY